jgi:hypothetical protein
LSVEKITDVADDSCKIPYEIEPGIFWCEPGNLVRQTGNLGGSAVADMLDELQPRRRERGAHDHESYAANG